MRLSEAYTGVEQLDVDESPYRAVKISNKGKSSKFLLFVIGLLTITALGFGWLALKNARMLPCLGYMALDDGNTGCVVRIVDL